MRRRGRSRSRTGSPRHPGPSTGRAGRTLETRRPLHNRSSPATVATSEAPLYLTRANPPPSGLLCGCCVLSLRWRAFLRNFGYWWRCRRKETISSWCASPSTFNADFKIAVTLHEHEPLPILPSVQPVSFSCDLSQLGARNRLTDGNRTCDLRSHNRLNSVAGCCAVGSVR